ncbi:hypothetical protein B0H17DRAFT_1337613 [Mycena rosella]|uniref:Uncharacterized protein n=1 Tax=Mycena rosella TaxID=1033263 RepID=A0AAD7CR89_MYCRO|nr:hypothetical protein B0H17DRAFT_1337613 [Mycena rosella]
MDASLDRLAYLSLDDHHDASALDRLAVLSLSDPYDAVRQDAIAKLLYTIDVALRSCPMRTFRPMLMGYVLDVFASGQEETWKKIVSTGRLGLKLSLSSTLHSNLPESLAALDINDTLANSLRALLNAGVGFVMPPSSPPRFFDAMAGAMVGQHDGFSLFKLVQFLKLELKDLLDVAADVASTEGGGSNAGGETVAAGGIGWDRLFAAYQRHEKAVYVDPRVGSLDLGDEDEDESDDIEGEGSDDSDDCDALRMSAATSAGVKRRNLFKSAQAKRMRRMSM